MDMAKVIFDNGVGDIGTIYLDMNYPEVYNKQLVDGRQIINVYSISMTPPTKYVPGMIFIECDFTDRDGNSPLIFNGLIAAWTMP
jgi:hypothetical protein